MSFYFYRLIHFIVLIMMFYMRFLFLFIRHLNKFWSEKNRKVDNLCNYCLGRKLKEKPENLRPVYVIIVYEENKIWLGL